MSDKPVIEVLEDDAQGPDHSEPAYNASDPEQVNLRRRKAGRVAKEKVDFIATIMADKAGRAWIYGLLEAAHCFRTSYVHRDAYATTFQEGERNLGLRVLNEVMRAAPAQYVTMLDEATKK